MATEAEIAKLAEAMWQLLDDMRTDGLCSCKWSIAEARIAFEPFRVGDLAEACEDIMPLDVAEGIVRSMRT